MSFIMVNTVVVFVFSIGNDNAALIFSGCQHSQSPFVYPTTCLSFGICQLELICAFQCQLVITSAHRCINVTQLYFLSETLANSVGLSVTSSAIRLEGIPRFNRRNSDRDSFWTRKFSNCSILNCVVFARLNCWSFSVSLVIFLLHVIVIIRSEQADRRSSSTISSF